MFQRKLEHILCWKQFFLQLCGFWDS